MSHHHPNVMTKGRVFSGLLHFLMLFDSINDPSFIQNGEGIKRGRIVNEVCTWILNKGYDFALNWLRLSLFYHITQRILDLKVKWLYVSIK